MILSENIRKLKLYKFILQESNINRILLRCSQEAGFSMPAIRWSLLKLREINVRSLVDGNGISDQTLYAAINGERNNDLAQALVAKALGLTVSELFPEE